MEIVEFLHLVRNLQYKPISLKKNILFVGSFKEKSKDGSLGGQMFACNTLIKSNLSDYVNWHLVDSTADSNIIAGFFPRFLKSSKRFFIFIKYLFTKKIDIVLIFTSNGLSFFEKGVMALIVKFFTNKKVILAPRSGFIIEDIQNVKFFKRFIPFVISKCDIIICQSESWKLFFQNLNKKNEEKYKVIPNWINEKKYINIPLNEKKEIINILFLSWLDRNKGVFEIIEAVKMLVKENLNFNLILAGNGRDFKKISEDVELNGLKQYVELFGWATGHEKLDLLNNCDIYILPSHFEGYPNSLLEAMASGKACIATNVGAIPEIIKNETNGLLIEKKNVLQLYSALKCLILDYEKRISLSKNARNTIMLNNTEIIGIENYKKIFEICVE